MSIFRFKQFSIIQNDSVFKVGTDGCLLGALADVSGAETVLDVGTGTGLLSLMCAQRNSKAQITAIDVNMSAVALARSNFENSSFHTRLRASSEILEELVSKDQKFDVIICNPPFFKSSIRSADINMAIARHEPINGLSEMLDSITALLNVKGSGSIIIPSDRVVEVTHHFSNSPIKVIRQISIRPFGNKPVNRVILILSTKSQKITEEELVLYSEQGVLTEQAANILRPFYLKL